MTRNDGFFSALAVLFVCHFFTSFWVPPILLGINTYLITRAVLPNLKTEL